MVFIDLIGGYICLKFQTSIFGNKKTSTNWKLLYSVNTFTELRDLFASHCAKEFSNIFNYAVVLQWRKLKLSYLCRVSLLLNVKFRTEV